MKYGLKCQESQSKGKGHMLKKLNPIVWASLGLIGLAALFFLIPRSITKAPVRTSVLMKSDIKPRERPVTKTSSTQKGIIPVPPQTKIISSDSSVTGELRESIAKLESELSPVDLQLFYTDLLLKDWIVLRDSLTEGVGWSGVFLQIDEPEKRLGIFTNVKTIGSKHTESRISLYLVEEI